MENKNLKIETVPIDSVIPDPANARIHSTRNLLIIKGSLARFGQQKPIVVTMDNVIRAGNGTWLAAKELGWTSISIIRTELKGPEAIAYSLTDNRSSEFSEWNPDVISAQLNSLVEDGWDASVLSSIGFDQKEIADWSVKDVDLLSDPDESLQGDGLISIAFKLSRDDYNFVTDALTEIRDKEKCTPAESLVHAIRRIKKQDS